MKLPSIFIFFFFFLTDKGETTDEVCVDTEVGGKHKYLVSPEGNPKSQLGCLGLATASAIRWCSCLLKSFYLALQSLSYIFCGFLKNKTKQRSRFTGIRVSMESW